MNINRMYSWIWRKSVSFEVITDKLCSRQQYFREEKTWRLKCWGSTGAWFAVSFDILETTWKPQKLLTLSMHLWALLGVHIEVFVTVNSGNLEWIFKNYSFEKVCLTVNFCVSISSFYQHNKVHLYIKRSFTHLST